MKQTEYIFINTDFYLETDIDFADMDLNTTKIVVPKLVITELSNTNTEKAKKILENINTYKSLSYFIVDETTNTFNIFDYIKQFKSAMESKYIATFSLDLLASNTLDLALFFECDEFRSKESISSSKVESFLTLLEEKASDGEPAAQYYLGCCFYQGYGKEQDDKKAFEWFKKAAIQGYAKAQNCLGFCYYRGRGVERSYKQAAEWTKKAAQQGYASAQFNLGISYRYGDGVEQDYKQAIEWLIKAAEQEFIEAQTQLGLYLETNLIEEQYYKRIADLLEKTANRDIVEAQYYYGVCFYLGKGRKQDYNQAYNWFDKAANKEYAKAQNMYGFCYYNGYGVKQDYHKAIEWYRKADKQGFTEAQYNLGVCYEEGHGVIQSYTQAFEWYMKAADRGNANAQNKVGICYERGNGIEQNYQKAIDWYRRAAERGHVEAQDRLDAITKKKSIDNIVNELNADLINKEHSRAQRWYRTCIVVIFVMFAGFGTYMWWNVCSIEANSSWKNILVRVLISMSFLSMIFVFINQAARARKTMVLLSREIQEFIYIGALLKGKVDMSNDALKTQEDIDNVLSKMLDQHIAIQKSRVEKEDHSEIKDITPEVLSFYKDHTSTIMNNYNDMQKTVIENLKSIMESYKPDHQNVKNKQSEEE